jgi:hypothetical protein
MKLKAWWNDSDHKNLVFGTLLNIAIVAGAVAYINSGSGIGKDLPKIPAKEQARISAVYSRCERVYDLCQDCREVFSDMEDVGAADSSIPY